MNICDVGVENLRVGIVMGAVSDYCHSLGRIEALNRKCSARKKIIKNGLRRKNPKHYTEEEAEAERQHQITVEMARLAEIERFFHSEWYSQLCNINGDKMIEGAKEKYKRTRFMKKLRRIKKYKRSRGIENARLKKVAT